jgi:TonB family protein
MNELAKARMAGWALFCFIVTCSGIKNSAQPALSGTSSSSAPTKAMPRTYNIAQINAHMNDIPTGTKLAVRGIYVSPHVSGGWAPSTELGDDGWVVPTQLDPCSVLLYGGTVRVQHGEADPRDYCRFSAVLQDENTSQIEYLECVMGLEEARAAMHQYRYKSPVQAHGTYASSLDFDIMPAYLGHQFGIPVLDNCALESSPALPVPTAPAPVAGPPAPSASPTLDNILSAINAEDSRPENRFKPYPVDADLERDVRQALSTYSVLKNAVITPVSLHREVTLSGTVPNESCRELAELIAKYVPGVAEVHNNLTVGIPRGAGNGYEPGSGGNAGGGYYQVGGGISAPEVIHSVEAQFSDEARRAKYQGVCLISLIVDAQGNPQNIHVARSLGKGLDEKAIEAVGQYKFRPAMKDGQTPVPVMITLEVDFRLY